MSAQILTFKPTNVTVTLGGVTYELRYDLNAIIMLENIYGSVDYVLNLMLGNFGDKIKVDEVKVDGNLTDIEKITVGDKPLALLLASVPNEKVAKAADTLNLLWLGCIHAYTEYDDDGNPISYKIKKSDLGKLVTLSNYREVNKQIVTAFLRDLVPAKTDDEGKNAAPVEQ